MIKCDFCFDTGTIWDGKLFIACVCEEGKKMKEHLKDVPISLYPNIKALRRETEEDFIDNQDDLLRGIPFED